MRREPRTGRACGDASHVRNRGVDDQRRDREGFDREQSTRDVLHRGVLCRARAPGRTRRRFLVFIALVRVIFLRPARPIVALQVVLRPLLFRQRSRLHPYTIKNVTPGHATPTPEKLVEAPVPTIHGSCVPSQSVSQPLPALQALGNPCPQRIFHAHVHDQVLPGPAADRIVVTNLRASRKTSPSRDRGFIGSAQHSLLECLSTPAFADAPSFRANPRHGKHGRSVIRGGARPGSLR